MSIANSRTRRAEPRTAADLRARGFKILSIGRPYGWNPYAPRREWPDVEYKLVPLDGDRWLGLIKGKPHRSTAHVLDSRGYYFKKRPIGTYESRVAAAHAILDYLGRD